MLYKLGTKELFSDDGVLIKRVHCPMNMQRSDLIIVDGCRDRVCAACQNTIIETADYTDNQLIEFVRLDPGACLMLSPEQENIKVVFRHE